MPDSEARHTSRVITGVLISAAREGAPMRGRSEKEVQIMTIIATDFMSFTILKLLLNVNVIL